LAPNPRTKARELRICRVKTIRGKRGRGWPGCAVSPLKRTDVGARTLRLQPCASPRGQNPRPRTTDANETLAAQFGTIAGVRPRDRARSHGSAPGRSSL